MCCDHGGGISKKKNKEEKEEKDNGMVTGHPHTRHFIPSTYPSICLSVH